MTKHKYKYRQRYIKRKCCVCGWKFWSIPVVLTHRIVCVFCENYIEKKISNHRKEKYNKTKEGQND